MRAGLYIYNNVHTYNIFLRISLWLDCLIVAGDPIKDDMSILLGVQEVGAGAATHIFNIKDAIIKLLQDELGLEVLLTGPRIPIQENVATRSGTLPTQLESPTPTRRPAVLLRLKVPKESLLHWLQRRFSAYNRWFICMPNNAKFCRWLWIAF